MSDGELLDAERLREALLDLERTRARQQEALEVSAQLVRCLRVFTAFQEPHRIIPELLLELQRVLGFEDAFFLTEGEGGELRATAATSPRFAGSTWKAGQVLRRAAAGAAVSVFDVSFVEEWRGQPAAITEGVRSALHVRLHTAERAAFLVCTHGAVGYFAERHLRLAEQLAPLASQALRTVERTEELARVNAALRAEAAERAQAQRNLEAAQRELIDTARRAGMAEVATNVLHNVGNVMNSVHVAAASARSKLRAMPLEHVARAADLLASLSSRLAGDRRGELLPEFLSKLGAELLRAREAALAELDSLGGKLAHVASIIDLQQALAGPSAMATEVKVAEAVDEALQINAAGLARHRVEVLREIEPLPPLVLDRHRLLQVLTNLVSNAKSALASAPEPRRLHVRARRAGERLRVEVEDTGSGISAEDLPRIFQHGFTTRPDGHGFGLHYGALAIKQMEGEITAESAGPGKGARFTIELPLRERPAR
jgi:C4-dicarboxylate-specific signal transduction histidine kinase